jgi:hypothetical protein
VTTVEPLPVEATRPRRRRRPVFGVIALLLVLAALGVVAGTTIYGHAETADAFAPIPAWFSVTASLAAVPVAVLAGLGLLLGIVGLARRERSGASAVTALVLAFPLLGAAGFAGWVLTTVAVACAGPAGACG